MIDRLKRALVDSFVGAIALGYLLASAIIHSSNIFAAPVGRWIARKQYQAMLPGATLPQRLSAQEALPELIRFCLLIGAWYLLLRWLYFRAVGKDTSSRTRNDVDQGSAASMN